ncbi:MAG: efflux transporter outer membrane subunit [Deltaproteobacteria bacterium]|nr:efflux transporter outer membrane subunit [Deltaproteobacteria bacterium]
MIRLLSYLCCVCLLAGCMIGPDYYRPQIDIPEACPLELAQAQQYSNIHWWQQFGDVQLNRLIEVALEQNLDLAVAAARIEELSARHAGSRSVMWPRLDGQVEWSRSSTAGQLLNQNSLALSSSWELDLWGRLRRNSEAATAELVAGEAGRSSLVLSLVAQVASNYLDLCLLDRQLTIAQSTAASRHEVLQLIQLRLDAGLATSLELVQVRSEYQAALAVIPQFKLAISEREHHLCLLLGRNPGRIERGLTLDQLSIPVVPGALPAQLLLQRPDIVAAEHSLIAANARIGVAKAAYFPAISLTGVLGGVSSELSTLVTGSSKTWSLSAPLSMPIFNAGQIKSEVEIAQAQKQQALLVYRQTALAAFHEVVDALVRQQLTNERLLNLRGQLFSLREYVELAHLLYDEGNSSSIENLDAQRSLFSIELDYAAEQTALLQSFVELYKVMGGGWRVCDEISME